MPHPTWFVWGDGSLDFFPFGSFAEAAFFTFWPIRLRTLLVVALDRSSVSQGNSVSKSAFKPNARPKSLKICAWLTPGTNWSRLLHGKSE
jgi:hypothetical protein